MIFNGRNTENEKAQDSVKSWAFFVSGRRDLNPRPLAPQASGLAGLRHVPMNYAYFRQLSTAKESVFHSICISLTQ